MVKTQQAVKLPSGNLLDLSGPTLVMAIVNCNEDSFYAPSRALQDKAVEMALAAEKDGASIVDFGAESTRPGSSYICAEEELERLIPVITAFRKRSPIPVSVDTRKAVVAAAALDSGADIINDISALSGEAEGSLDPRSRRQVPGMAAVCAGRGAAVVLMHRKGVPRTMQENPLYEDLISEISSFFRAAIERVLAAGISGEKIILDPGFGFGKTLENNLEILRRMGSFTRLPRLAEKPGTHYPVMVGLSRKKFIGEVSGRDVAGRLPATLAANGAAIMGGAKIIRVHDVKEHVDLAKMLFALQSEK